MSGWQLRITRGEAASSVQESPDAQIWECASELVLCNERTTNGEQVVEQNQPTVSEEIIDSVVVEESTASSIEQMSQADLLSIILQTIQKGEESRQKDKEEQLVRDKLAEESRQKDKEEQLVRDKLAEESRQRDREEDRKCLQQLKQDIVKSPETVTSLFRAELEALNNKIAGCREQETTKLAQSVSLLRSDTQLKVDSVNSRMNDIVECVNEKLDDVTNSLNEKIVNACQGMDDKLAHVKQSIETQISNTVPNANHVKELVSTEVERSMKHIVEQELITFKEVCDESQTNVRETIASNHRTYAAKINELEINVSRLQEKLVPNSCLQTLRRTVDSDSHGSSSVGSSDVPVDVNVVHECGEAGSFNESRNNVRCNKGSEVHTLSSDGNIVNNSDVEPRNEYVNVNNMQCHSGLINDVSLPKFTDSSKQNPVQFLLDLDLYFMFRKIPEQFKLPLATKSVSDLYVVNWLHSVI
jgi:hypothetical protein